MVLEVLRSSGWLLSGALALQNWLLSSRPVLVPPGDQHCHCACECEAVAQSWTFAYLSFVCGLLFGGVCYHGWIHRSDGLAWLRRGRQVLPGTVLGGKEVAREVCDQPGDAVPGRAIDWVVRRRHSGR